MNSMTLFYCLGIFFGVIFFLSSMMVSGWIIVKHKKGNITDEKPKEMIHLHPLEDSSVRPQTLQTDRENSRGLQRTIDCFHNACGEPPKYETMALRDSPKKYYEVGEEVYYQCYPGYLTLRSVVTYCEQNHSWYPLEEACFRKECNTPGLENGEVFAPNFTFQFDSEAYFYCNEGCNPSQGPDEFSLVGNSKLICVDNNKWSSSPPECKGYPEPNDPLTFEDFEELGIILATNYSAL
ncbi:hypothetical protein GH733_010713 [Mirounga leonina]|nr:hypothetical protein GH733_010713 [Mirounga leonina]